MTLNEYQQKAVSTALWESEAHMKIIYPALGLCGEAGEVAEKVKKTYRDESGVFSKEKKEAIAKELGDVLWYVSSLARDIDYTLEDIADMNITKIYSRKERGVTHGNGDDR